MLNNNKNTRIFKYLLRIPLACLLFFVFSCEDEIGNNTTTNEKTSVEIEKESTNEDYVIAEEPVATEDQVFSIVENPPKPEGGMQNLFAAIGKNFQYPEEAKNKKIEGTVFVEFIINKEGEITNVKLKKGIGAGCDKAAIEALKGAAKSVKFSPGTQRGKPVKVKMVLPILFKLN